MKYEQLKNLISRSDIEDLYLVKELPKDRVAKELHICNNTLNRLLEDYQITRDSKAVRARHVSQAAKKAFKLKNNISKEDIIQWYIIEDHPYSEAAKHFGITQWAFDKLCSEYGIKKDASQVQLKKWGYYFNIHGGKDAAVKELQRARVKSLTEKYGSIDNYRASISNKCSQTWADKSAEELREIAERRAFTKQSIIASDGTNLDSNWELDIYEYCLRNNIPIERNIPINYKFKGKNHTTLIDFRIDGILFEIKGNHLLHGVYDYKGVPISVKLDLYRDNHIVIITGEDSIFGKPNSTESNGFKYPEKCPRPLIGVDIDLFRQPEFPYAKNRPRCFYNVRVANQKSALEAFNDEAIRWKMIKNRIMYSGGFINAKQILDALNITRTCKQPSWFSKSFAKYIINNYITSDIIVDPFAGWGARYDACKDLHKTYIGCDLNPELVDWHHEMGRDIKLGDAEMFTYDGECSVFICPPYQDVETYFEGQDLQTTQCQWLSKVMENVPNAKEYVMVCKVVDPGWEKYIVYTKENKSHFGLNKEYILKVEKD